jgi:hypothetical protein
VAGDGFQVAQLAEFDAKQFIRLATECMHYFDWQE